jgi:AraC-like DNA-binding protein
MRIEGQQTAEGGGLFRAALAGPGRTLTDVFANLERNRQVDWLWRHPKRNLIGARVTLTPQEGKGYWEFTKIRDEVFVVIENRAFRDKRIETLPGDGLVQFNFKVSGDLTLGVSPDKPLRFNRPSLLVWAQGVGVDTTEWTAPSTHERNVSISVRPEYLVENLLTTTSNVPEKLLAFIANPRDKSYFTQISLSARMFEAVSRLIDNSFTGSLALAHTEAVALELLCNAAASLSSPVSQCNEYSDRELRCLHAARELLMRQLAPAPTIRQIARSVGIAETTLGHAFKSLFGETLFEFSLRCRMAHALHMLRDKHCTVAEAAYAIGYAHTTSFTTAFSSYYGTRPIDVRRVKLQKVSH